MDPTTFLYALAAIVVIDLVLAGDNAIVIALAARALPAHLQKRAIVWGAVGAIAVRGMMTVIVVWLLNVPGLLLAGGLMLIWIGYRLLLPDESEGHGPGHVAATSFWGAMRTIVIADAVMGLDNVLAVAGAAHGSYLLVMLGLAISVPIVVWGSTVVLKVVERYPGVVYLGAAVLVWTACKMITSDPWLATHTTPLPLFNTFVYAAIPLVLLAAFVKNHRVLESRIHARLAEFRAQTPLGVSDSPIPPRSLSPSGARTMLKVLVPVDGSPNALRALRHAIAEYQRDHELELHILNVQPPLSRQVARFLSHADREGWHRDQAEAALAGARELLSKSGIPFEAHWKLGDRASEICQTAQSVGAHHIVMGTARKNSITRMLEDSVTNKVLEHTPVPVEVVAGDAISKWERWGLPAGVLGGGGMLLFAAID